MNTVTLGKMVTSKVHNPSAFKQSIIELKQGQPGRPLAGDQFLPGDSILFDLPGNKGFWGEVINMNGKKGIRFEHTVNGNKVTEMFLVSELRDLVKVKLNRTRKGPMVNEASIQAQADAAASAAVREGGANAVQAQSIRQKVQVWYDQSSLVRKTRAWSQARTKAEAANVIPGQEVTPKPVGLQRQNASKNVTYDPALEKTVYSQFMAKRPQWLDRWINREAKKPPTTVPTKETVRTAEETVTVRANNASSSGRISTRTKNLLIMGGLGAAVAASVGYGVYALASRTGAAVEQHQADQNGCWLVELNPGLSPTMKKIEVLSCGTTDVTDAMETCVPDPSKPCSETQFNPCLRATGTTPSCTRYVYKGTKPAPKPNVTTLDACRTEDAKPLSDKQNCSNFCVTSNFELEEDQELVCIDLDYNAAFVDLLQALEYTPAEIDEIIPPKDPFPPVVSSFSKPLLMATVALGGLFLILGVVWWRRANASRPRHFA